MRRIAALVLFASATAHADKAADVTKVLASLFGTRPATMHVPTLAITNGYVDTSSGSSTDQNSWMSLLVPSHIKAGKLAQPIAGVSADGTAGWVAAQEAPDKCIRGSLPDDTSGDSIYDEPERCMWEDKGAFERAALVAEYDGKAWQPVVWHVFGYSKGAALAGTLDDLKPAIASGAQDAEKQFETTIGDPKALVKTLSPRTDVLMFGSAAGERFVGPQVAATLAKWNLSLTPRGVRAGVAGKSVAWVVANLEAASLAKPKAKHSFYRALFVYEHAGDAWQLVQLSFSEVQPPRA